MIAVSGLEAAGRSTSFRCRRARRTSECGAPAPQAMMPTSACLPLTTEGIEAIRAEHRRRSHGLSQQQEATPLTSSREALWDSPTNKDRLGDLKELFHALRQTRRRLGHRSQDRADPACPKKRYARLTARSAYSPGVGRLTGVARKARRTWNRRNPRHLKSPSHQLHLRRLEFWMRGLHRRLQLCLPCSVSTVFATPRLRIERAVDSAALNQSILFAEDLPMHQSGDVRAPTIRDRKSIRHPR